MTEGDILTPLQVGDLVLLTAKQSQVPQIADKIIAIIENEGVNLTDLLVGVEAERKAIWRSQQQ